VLSIRAFHYDANGRLDCRGASTSACTGGNRIEWFVGGGVREVNNGPLKSVFTYGGADRRRVRQTVSHASLPNAAQNRTITYVGAHFEVETEQATGKSRYRLSTFAGGRAVYQRVETIVSNAAQAPEAYYLHRDHLGSVDKLSPAISGGSGVTAYSFDAFGGRRGTNWQADSTTYGQNHWTDRGYTGHEHLDDVELIHMNGRVQHPGLGRFLSPDPLLGDPANPQTLNRYAYVSNNPLALVDPSGFCEAEAGSDGGRCGEVVVTATRNDGFGSRIGGVSWQGPPPAGSGATADPTLRDISAEGLMQVGGLTASALEGLSLANIKGLIEKQVALDLIRDLRKAANPAAFRNNLTREGKRLLEMGRAMVREAEGKNVSAKLAAAQRSLGADVALVKSVGRGAAAVGPLITLAEVSTGSKTPAEGAVDGSVYAATGAIGLASGWVAIGLGLAYGVADMAGYGDPFRAGVISGVEAGMAGYTMGMEMQSFGCPPVCTMVGGY
jgi:RHS repeat-associated protein